MNMQFQVLLVMVLFVLFSVFVRWQQKTWMSPAALFTLFWTALCGLSVVMAPDFYFSPKALLFILSILIAFYTGAIIGQAPPLAVLPESTGQTPAAKGAFMNRALLIYLIPTTLSGFVAVYLLLGFYGYHAEQLLSPAFADMTQIMTKERYIGISLPKPIMICSVVIDFDFQGHAFFNHLSIFRLLLKANILPAHD